MVDRRLHRLSHRFVELIPDQLEPGTLYVSIKYRTAAHICCCGCGDRVVTPLSPADWAFTFNGRGVALWPSIGGGPCRSHYIVRTGGVIAWGRPLSDSQMRTAFQRDKAAAERLHSQAEPEIAETKAPISRGRSPRKQTHDH